MSLIHHTALAVTGCEKKGIWHYTWTLYSQLPIYWQDKSTTYFPETKKKSYFNTFRIPCINLYKVHQNQQNALNSSDVLILIFSPFGEDFFDSLSDRF